MAKSRRTEAHMQTWFPIVQSRVLVVRAHYSWLIVLGLGAWSLTQVVLPARLDSDARVWPLALLLMVVFVGCVLVHELAQISVTRLLGARLHTLNLYPLGSIARRGRERAGPGRAFAIAAAGPFANLLLWFMLRRITSTSEPAQTVISFAAAANLTLALINLLPGLPLDGGRMLRAVIWFGSDFASATRVATIAGYAVTAGTFIIALRNLDNPDTLLRGVWLLLLSWLIYAAGTSLARRRAVGTLFERLTVRDVMHAPQHTAEPTVLLRDLVKSWGGLSSENATPIVRDGCLLGLMTRSRAADVPQGYWGERTAAAAMIPLVELPTLAPDTPLSAVLARLDLDPEASDAVPLLVLEEGRLIGVIEPRELIPLLDVQEEFGLAPLDVAATETAAGARHLTPRDKPTRMIV